MNHWKQLGIPVAIGLVAAVLNWYSVSSKLQPLPYVGVSEHVNPGDAISKDMLVRLEINGDPGLAQAALPWDQRAILFGWRATRRLQKGSLILRRDVIPDGAAVGPDEREFTVSLPDLDAPPDLYEDCHVSFALTDDRRLQSDPKGGMFGAASDDDGFVGPFRVVAITYQASKETAATGIPRIDRLTLVTTATTGSGEMERLLRAFHRDDGKRVLAIVRDAGGGTDEKESPAAAAAALPAREG